MSGMDFSPEILRPAAELFFEGGPDGISILSSSEREEDVRAAALAVKNGQKSVVKLASNAFTTSRRIKAGGRSSARPAPSGCICPI